MEAEECEFLKAQNNLSKFVTIFFVTMMVVHSVNAQYTGGSNDGYSDGALMQTTCPDPTPNFIYYGGNADGYGDGTLTQSTCPDLTLNFIYYGGNADGYGDGTLTQSTCPDLTLNFIYYGGTLDGYGDGKLTQAICPDLTPNFIYYGGNADGYTDGTLTQAICPNPTPDFIYYGGVSDGFGWHFIQPIVCTTPLQIELLEFKARLGKEGVEISWITASEINNDFFTVEKSTSGLDFYSIAKVKGAGNSTQQMKYSVTDISPFQGINYYRLKQTDFDGKFEYSEVISVNVGASLSTHTIHPNPNEGTQFYVNLPNAGDRTILVKIQSLDGKAVHTESVFGSSTFEITPSGKLAPGVYVVTIIDRISISNHKLVVY